MNTQLFTVEKTAFAFTDPFSHCFNSNIVNIALVFMSLVSTTN